MESVICNLCHSSESIPIFRQTDLLLERDDVFATFVKCQQCGLLYQNPRPTPDEMETHYPPEYESFNPEPSEKKASWLLSLALHRGINKRTNFVTRHKEQGRLLDIGCSTGYFLRGMRMISGWEVYGVEVSSHAAQIARQKYNLNVFNGTLDQANYPNGYFDAITLWDVLEHLHDPKASLREIHRVLKPDGLLVLRIPNGKSWDAQLFGQYWAGLDAPRHLYVFDQGTLRQILEAVGFSIKEMSCQIGSYPTFVLDIRFWLYKVGVSVYLRKLISSILYHPISRILSSPFFFIVSMGLRGPLLTAIAVKDDKSP
jgi:ubiquinone/menaquinone biosynthesis C-methylase UbiE